MAAIGDSGRPDRSHLSRRLRLASLALLWERLWPALAPAAAVVVLFLVVALFDLPERLPGMLQLGLLVLFGIGLAAALVWGFRGFRLPHETAARRRIERDSGLVHRPLAAIDDTIASGAGDADSLALWQAHRRRMAAAARRLKLTWPKAGLVERDPVAIRALLALLLVLAAIDAGGDWAERIGRSLAPHLGPVAAVPMASLDIWVTPPDYTGLPPRLLPKTAHGRPIEVPAGSMLLAQVHGKGAVPQLTLAGTPRRFQRIDDANFKIETRLTRGGALAVSQDGTELGRWPIAIVPDRPPTIAFVGRPRQTENFALRLEYRASDDYGVEGVRAVMTLNGNPKARPLAIDLALPGLHEKAAHGVSYNDLTANPWAGLPVTARLEARDALHQTGSSEPMTFTLPERLFRNPVARAIIAARKELTLHPGRREAVAQALSNLSLRPGTFGGDVVVFLALRTAMARLILNPDPDTIPAVQQLLWQTALRLEDGRAPEMQRDLRDAMQALKNALARNAPNAEIDRLMQRLRTAIDRYLAALMQNALRQGLKNMPGLDPSQMTMTDRDLEDMLNRAQSLAHTGAREAARDLLSQLQDMLENLRLGRMGANEGPAERMMNQLQRMMQRQQRLLDKSFHDSRSGRTNESQSAQSQAELQRMLGELMRQLGAPGGKPGGKEGGAPQSLQRAERAMGNAAGQLRNGNPAGAIGPQTEALDQLQQGARGLAQKMFGRNGRPGMGPGEMAGRDGLAPYGRDPFGRRRPGDERNGWVDDGGPMRFGTGPDSNSALRRAKAILDELRRRAGDRSRPELERDYIDRLLREF
jgi:uncharacterized protein (TIGR02302 family)